MLTGNSEALRTVSNNEVSDGVSKTSAEPSVLVRWCAS